MSVLTDPTLTRRALATCSYESEALLLMGSKKGLSVSNIDVFPWAAYSWPSRLIVSSSKVTRPPGVEDLVCSQKIERSQLVTILGKLRIQRNEFNVPTSLKAARVIGLIRKIVLQ